MRATSISALGTYAIGSHCAMSAHGLRNGFCDCRGDVERGMGRQDSAGQAIARRIRGGNDAEFQPETTRNNLPRPETTKTLGILTGKDRRSPILATFFRQDLRRTTPAGCIGHRCSYTVPSFGPTTATHFRGERIR